MSISKKAIKICVAIAIQVACVGLFLGWIHYLKQVSPNRDDAKLEEIKAEVTKIPIYPGFKKVGEHDTSRHMDASSSLYYSSDAHRPRVESFYEDQLNRLGWKINRDSDSLYFQKNDLRLHIYCRPDESDWNYSISIEWRNPEI